MTSAHSVRFTAPEAVASGLVDATGDLHSLQEEAAGLVRHLAGKDRRTLGTIKATLFAETAEALTAPRG